MGLFGFGVVDGIVEHVLETSIHIFYLANKTYKLLYATSSPIPPLEPQLPNYKHRTRELDSVGWVGRVRVDYTLFGSIMDNRITQQVYNMQMSNQIEIPPIILEQPQFCLRINENNSKLFTHVEYLRSLVTNIHQMYSQLCKRLVYLTDEYERRLISMTKNKTPHSQVIMEFVKSISFLHFSISSQLNSNSVTLGTKTYRIARNRVENLKERLVGCNQICKEYIAEITLFNKEQREFVDSCEYFKDYEKDVLKYYSLKANVELSDRLQIQEMKLKQSQEHIFRKKQDYQAQVHQIRAGLKDYYELQKNIIAEYSRLLLNIRNVKRQNAQVYAQVILELSSEPSQSHYSVNYRDEVMVTKRSEKTVEKTVAQIRREIVKEEEKIVLLETHLQEFVHQYQEALKAAAEKIDELRSSSEYQKFSNDKLVISQILPYDSIREIDLIVNEISLLRTILLNLNTIFGKMKVIKEISKYRISNFDKFVEDTQQFVDEERKNMLSVEQREKFGKYQTKFLDRNNELTSRYRQRIVQLQNSILNEYKRQDIAYEDKYKKTFKNGLFEKAYYEILMSPFFLNRSESINYKENPYLKKIKMHLSANQVQKSITLEGLKPFKPRKNCCGGLFLCGDDDVQGLHILKEYICALKDGLMLIQGKMRLYEHHLGFTSQFNSKTLFGYTDIRIPKWDIYQIISGKNLLSVKITLQTTHGNINFTNFMTMQDPYQKLMQFYDSKKNVGSIVHKDNQVDSELVLLQQRFQSDFQSQLRKVGIIVDTLSTYLSEDKQKLSISIEYHMNGSSCHAMFEIKIIQKTTATDYYFIHDHQSKNNQTKSLVENISKKLINMKDSEMSSNVIDRVKEKELSFSIIEGNQKNKISFQRQPSFINIQDSESMDGDINLEEMKINQLQLGYLLTSRILSGIQYSRNFQMDTKLPSERKNTQRDHDKSGNINAIEFASQRSWDEGSPRTIKQELSSAFLKSKKIRICNSSASQQYSPKTELKRQKMSIKTQSTKSKSINLQKYQGIFYFILGLFILNLILNWID